MSLINKIEIIKKMQNKEVLSEEELRDIFELSIYISALIEVTSNNLCMSAFEKIMLKKDRTEDENIAFNIMHLRTRLINENQKYFPVETYEPHMVDEDIEILFGVLETDKTDLSNREYQALRNVYEFILLWLILSKENLHNEYVYGKKGVMVL